MLTTTMMCLIIVGDIHFPRKLNPSSKQMLRTVQHVFLDF
uniref:Uncharacterized protein n=1 Tax=Rhizophora mucronata TaxID=61149 RepID=A0A2P2Q6H5_RHIMU